MHRMSSAAVTSPPTIASAERASASGTDGSTSCTAAIAAARAGGVAPAPCLYYLLSHVRSAQHRFALLCGPTAAQSSNIPPRRPGAVLPAAKAPPRFAERPASSAHASRPRPRCSRLHGAAAEVGSLCLAAQVSHRWHGGAGTARRGTARHGTARHGMDGVARHGWCGTAQYGMARHGMARHSTARHSTAWHSTARHMARHGTNHCELHVHVPRCAGMAAARRWLGRAAAAAGCGTAIEPLIRRQRRAACGLVVEPATPSRWQAPRAQHGVACFDVTAKATAVLG